MKFHYQQFCKKKIEVAILTSQMGKYAKNNKQLRIALKKCKYDPLLVTSLILSFFYIIWITIPWCERRATSRDRPAFHGRTSDFPKPTKLHNFHMH